MFDALLLEYGNWWVLFVLTVAQCDGGPRHLHAKSLVCSAYNIKHALDIYGYDIYAKSLVCSAYNIKHALDIYGNDIYAKSLVCSASSIKHALGNYDYDIETYYSTKGRVANDIYEVLCVCRNAGMTTCASLLVVVLHVSFGRDAACHCLGCDL